MADNTGGLEGEPYGTIDFHVVHIDRRVDLVPIELGLRSLHIAAHKHELAQEFGVEGQVQTWKYNGEILQDDKSLLDYGIDGTEPAVIHVTVS